MRSLRRFCAHVLLAVMAVAIAPQEFWHACEHGPLVQHPDEGTQTVEASCAMCDIGMPVAVGSAVLDLTVVSSIDFQVTCPAIAGMSLGFTPLAADRGPPALA